MFFFFKQKTAYEMRISDWSSDVCSSDLRRRSGRDAARSGARCPGTWASGNLQERREPRAFWESRGKPGLASRAAARARARAGRASLSSGERRVGEEGVSTCRTRGSADHEQTKPHIQ